MTFTTAESLLLASLHLDPARLDPALSRASAGDWEDLLDLAKRQHVRPLVRRRLMSGDVRERVPPGVLEALSKSHQATAFVNLTMHGELARFLKAMAAEDMP